MKRRLLIFIATAVILSFLVWVLPTETCLASGTINLNVFSGTVGTTVTVTGTGFSTSVTVSQITLTSTTDSTTTSVTLTQLTNSDGDFTAYFKVPVLPNNSYSVTFTSASTSANSSPETAMTYSNFTITQSISLDSSEGQVGSQVTINGNGFAAGPAKVNVYIDSSATGLGSMATTSTGTFSSLRVTIPDAPAGSHNIRVTDSAGNSTSCIYTIRPKVTINPVFMAPGTPVSIFGKGYAASSTVNFILDNIRVASGTATNEMGNFSSFVLTIPAIASGNHLLKIVDDSNNFDSITITTNQSLTINPQSGQVGSDVTITGSGFGAVKNITICFKGKKIATDPETVISDSFGNIHATITVPPSVAGIYAVSVSDAISTSSANFIIAAAITMDQTSGGSGTTIPISGSGFTGNTNITIKYDGNPIASTKTDDTGYFSTDFIVPPGPAGQHKVVVSDGMIPASTNFTSTASTQISSASVSGSQISGNVGSELTIKGSAFTPGATVSVSYDSTKVATASVDNTGSFSASFKIPASKAGKHTITASDGSNSVSNTFIMDSTPPSAPNLVSPARMARMNETPKLEWMPVQDPSGINYTLQISQDPEFSSVLLQKTGLVANNYQITSSEKLISTSPGQSYYWRVKAIDGASNESSWSAASSFTVSCVTIAWLQYLIFAAIGLVLFCGGFLLGTLFEFDASQLSRIKLYTQIRDLFPKIGDFFSRIRDFFTGLFNFGFARKILKKG